MKISRRKNKVAFCLSNLSLLLSPLVYGSPQYEVNTGAGNLGLPQMNIPTHLSNPEVNDPTPKILLQNATCIGVNTRTQGNLVDGYQAGRTWIRITIKSPKQSGMFSVPFEVFQTVGRGNVVMPHIWRTAPGATLSAPSSERISQMVNALKDSHYAAQVSKILTPGWNVEAAENTVRVTGIPKDLLSEGNFNITFEEVFTTSAPKGNPLDYGIQGQDPTAFGRRGSQAATGFWVEPKSSFISFAQNASWTERIQSASRETRFSSVKILRGQRPMSEVAYRANENTLLLEPIVFGGRSSGCGGYTSPIMAFFDDERPTFSADTSTVFENQTTAWVERNAPGYFLVIDNDGRGNISKSSQLFGNEGQFENGFEKLKAYDSNHDGKIDRRDPIFSKLRLWKDTNSNSVSDKGELRSLEQMNIRSINLKYHSGDIRRYYGRAESHQWTEFEFINHAGKKREGKMIDIWFKRIPFKQSAALGTETWTLGKGG